MKLFVKIGLVLVWIGLGLYLVVTLSFTDGQMDDQTVVKLVVNVDGPADEQLILPKDVVQKLINHSVRITNEPIDSIDKSYVRGLVKDIPVVKEARVFFTPDGLFHINVEQRKPVFRVLTTQGSYYFDEDATAMRVSTRNTPKVPVVTGELSLQQIQEELFSMLAFVSKDQFWQAQIDQVHAWALDQIEIVPKIGDHRIFMGSADNYRWKLEKLKAVYEKGLSNVGWDAYSEIDLRYENQVVCKRR